jgi:hypothetical protein
VISGLDLDGAVTAGGPDELPDWSAGRIFGPVGLDYWIWPGQPGGLGSSLSDLLGRLPARTLSAELPVVLALARSEVSRDAELLLPRHENAVLRADLSTGTVSSPYPMLLRKSRSPIRIVFPSPTCHRERSSLSGHGARKAAVR